MKTPFESSSAPAATGLPCIRWRVALVHALAVTLSLTLSACGGGGDPDSSPTTSAPTSTSASTLTSGLMQGRWVSTNLAPAYTAILVPAPAGASASAPAVDTLWALAHDGSYLVKLKANGGAQTAGAFTGNAYKLGTSSVTAVTGASYTLSAGASGSDGNTSVQRMSLQPVLGTTALFDRTDAMASALRADQANGRWSANFGAVVVNWTVQSANTTGVPATTNLSGTSTSGCVYSGQSTVSATQRLYRVQFTETCSGPAANTQTFNGVATLTTDDAGMTVVVTNESETRAAVLMFVRQR